MVASLEEISKEEGTGFLRGVGYGITRMFFINSERVKKIHDTCKERPLFYVGTSVGALYMVTIYASGIYGIYQLYQAFK